MKLANRHHDGSVSRTNRSSRNYCLNMRHLVLLNVVFLVMACTTTSRAATTNLYHTNRTFRAVEFTNMGSVISSYEVQLFAGQLTAVVGPTNVIVNSNNTFATEYESFAWGYPTPEAAWAAVVSNQTAFSFIHPSNTYDNTGWVKGTREAYDTFGAFLWLLQNTVDFQTSETNVWISPNGVTNPITQVIVGSIGDYPPVTNVVDVGPVNWSEISEYPGMNMATDVVYRGDYNAYYNLLPVEVAPDVVRMNANYDEGRRDSETGYAIPDCEVEDLVAVRNSFHDSSIREGDIVIKDLHSGFFGVRPDKLPEGWAEDAVITIEKLPETDPVTGRPESGMIRIWAVKDLGQTGEQAWSIPLTELDEYEQPQPINLVPILYVDDPDIPHGDGVEYWIEGIVPGHITLQFSYTKGDLDYNFKQRFLVCTQQDRDGWREQVRQEILLDTLGDIDINDYKVTGGPWIDVTRSKYFMRNREYIEAVYRHYEKLYLTHEDTFLWAGLAKLAGAPVYAGLSDAQWGRIGSPVLPSPLFNVADPYLKHIQTILITANINIYNDLAWQFAAYRSSAIFGLIYVETIDAEGANYGAWYEIDNLDYVSGNVGLLRREQEEILADTYDQLGSMTLGLVDLAFSWLAKNPVPDGSDFLDVVPGGSLSNFDHRWAWIINSNNPPDGMWHIWINTSSNTRLNWVELLLKERAGDYRISTLLPIL